ncbi:glycosyl transferase family protein [Brevundimonas fontaquae]|uniref:Glycosyl transferase family protein n=1 Tax=Brevundimonas fontaquae TaxID=2813778 RepID=A0ABX7LP19_9CAUL|nr:glycosyl transferase family protein [Brevundimonas fontaquae]QSF53879.1 glycosyl transferase family protein [Brevundimonas fontaquae]
MEFLPTGADLHALLLGYWEVLRWAVLISAVLILVSSLDDLFIDLAYWSALLVRFCSVQDRPAPQRLLEQHPEKMIAIMVPAWQESDVIASMVANTNKTFDYSRYHIFVGVYANDAETRREVEKVRQRFPKVHRAEVPHDGPTSKADCLNWIVQNILLYEEKTGQQFEAFLMHDAEDVVHRFGLKTVNWFVDKAAMIQMPVLSMDRKWNNLVACHYMDEFAEFHTKDLPVRSALARMTPSAGVATAFHRQAMMALVEERQGQPFNTDSLTEDYDVAHRLSVLGYPSSFVRYHAKVPRQRKAWFRKGMVDISRRELVSTKEFFPHRFAYSVRQKARWTLGISIMGWAQLGWFGGLVNRYYLFRDRKALFTAPVGIIGYAIVIQLLGVMLLQWLWPEAINLPPLIDRRWVWAIVTFNFLFLLNRILHRAWFTGLNHGLKHVPLTPIRIVTSNLISFGAFWRASHQWINHLVTRRPIAWDKTQHAYPSLSELQQGTGRLGDTLRFWNHVSEADLIRALEVQKNRYRPLGLLLLDLAAVDDDHLAEAFAERGETYASIFDPFQIERGVLALLTPEEAARYGAVPLRRNGARLDVALAEPLPADQRSALEKRLGQQGVRSVRFLFAPLSDIAFAIRFAWGEDPFVVVREQLARLKAAGHLDASREAMLWRSVRAGYARLGDILIRQRRISHADLQTALAASRTEGRSLGETLTRLKLVAAADLEAALKDQRSARWLSEHLAEALRSAPVDDRHLPRYQLA